MKEINRYRDLEEMGFGVRTTIDRKIEKDIFPEPDADDGTGHPVWFRETVERHKESLKKYTPVVPKNLGSFVRTTT